MDKNCFNKISDMLKAYYPIIYLSTFEYDKAKQQKDASILLSVIAKSEKEDEEEREM